MSAWIQLFDELDRIYRSVASLLKDADDAMDRVAYVCWETKGNKVGMETSASLQEPSRWYPSWVVRFYAQKDSPYAPVAPMAFVAVFLGDEASTGDWRQSPRLEEPVVVAGVIHPKADLGIEWEYWHAKHWFWCTDKELGGRTSTYVVKPEEKYRNFERVETFAVPISRVGDGDGLRTHVLDRLQAMLPVERSTEGPGAPPPT